MDSIAAGPVRFVLMLAAVLGCALVAGVFFAFSAFVMKALARLPAKEGIAAMQPINVSVLNPRFMAAFFGTAAACLVAAIGSLTRWHEPGAALVWVGSLLHLAGSVGVTIVCNVPRNNALASVTPRSPDGARHWAGCVVGWTAWNHVRTASALGAAAFLSIGGWP